jgi:hypothetical protein
MSPEHDPAAILELYGVRRPPEVLAGNCAPLEGVLIGIQLGRAEAPAVTTYNRQKDKVVPNIARVRRYLRSIGPSGRP